MLSLSVMNSKALDLKRHADALFALPMKDEATKAYIHDFYQAIVHYNNKEYPQALTSLDKAMVELPETEDNQRRHISILSHKAEVKAQMGDYAAALEYTRAIYPYTQSTQNSDTYVDYVSEMSKYHKLAGNTDSALYYSDLYIAASDSLFGASRIGDLKDIIASRDMRAAAEKYRILEVSNNFYTIMTVVLTLGVLILLISLYYIVRQKRQIKARNVELYQRTQETLASRDAERQWRRAYLESDIQHPATEPAPLQIDPDLSNLPQQESEDTPAPGMPSTTSPELLALAERICHTLESDPAVYTEGFNMDALIHLTDSTRNNVSLALNRVLGKNFLTLLGEYRIRRACEYLSGPRSEQYTLAAVAQECGFKSRTNFVSIFKKNVGMTPSEYKKAAQAAPTEG